MGGWNSGGGRGALREENFWKLRIADLKRLGMLRSGYCGSLIWKRRGEEAARIGIQAREDRLILCYRSRARGGDWQDIEDVIPLTFTRPHLGGRRAWFVCPSCTQRKGVLWGRTYYRCARCHRMTYDSQYEDHPSRLLSKAQAILIKLGGTGNCSDPFPTKPKGMHWSTYSRLWQDHERLYTASMIAMARQLRIWKE